MTMPPASHAAELATSGGGPLAGIRVVDATNFVFGPLATQMLGDMGAEVIKVEPPEGDPTRRIGQSRTPLMGSFFLNLNRNKKSVVLDLKQPAAAAALRRLVGSADVLVHNMRSGAATKLGLGHATLGPLFPRLVHASALGFGAGGRYFDRPAYDDVIQSLSGIPGLNERMTGEAGYAPMLIADKVCGLLLCAAIAAALVQRERTGRGQAVAVPMFEAMAAFNLAEHLSDGVFASVVKSHDADADADTDAEADGKGASQPLPADTRAGQASSNTASTFASPLGYARVFGRFHRPLHTRDGLICVIANTDAQWRALFDAIGRPELHGDPRFASIGDRMANIDALYQLLVDALPSRSTADWLAAFEHSGIPAGPVNDLDALRHDPHLADVGFFRTHAHASEGALVMPASPLQFSASAPGEITGPPRLGEHNVEILCALGYSAEEAAALAAG